jgi:nucleotide-binding universal stress UspA family protein
MPSGAVFSAGDSPVRAAEHDYLEKLVRRLRAEPGLAVSAALVDGPIAATLLRQTQATGAGLVVMTTHGRGSLSRLWLGSVADRMVRQTTVPLLLVRPREEEAEPVLHAGPPHFLIPLDGSPLAEQVLGPAVSLGQPLGARYTLLQVISPVDRLVSEGTGCYLPGEVVVQELKRLEGTMRAHAEDYLGRITKDLCARSLAVEARVVSQEEPAVAIGEFAQANAVGIIALATHGRGGFARLFLGSVADKVLRSSAIPLLVCRPSASKTSERLAESQADQPAWTSVGV